MQIDHLDAEELIDTMGDSFLSIHQGRDPRVEFNRIITILYRYTLNFDLLCEALHNIGDLYAEEDVDIDLVFGILYNISMCIDFLRKNLLTEESKHLIYMPTVQAMNTLINAFVD